MGFITNDEAAPVASITNDGFFPDIDPSLAREALRLDGTVTNVRLINALIEAMTSVNDELDTWKATQTAAGHATLAEVPAKQINDASVNLPRYNRAVYALAKANLTEHYRDFDSTNAGNMKADQLENPIDTLYRDARWAICDIQGIGRNTVELI